eukprot:GHUV01034854.1.p2 GENE.GHUV01034854.1~~GHUV01034854.1.p2  ORF type:complete len:107 (-),score=25.01 GHUV01034854.1:432-752(-)
MQWLVPEAGSQVTERATLLLHLFRLVVYLHMMLLPLLLTQRQHTHSSEREQCPVLGARSALLLAVDLHVRPPAGIIGLLHILSMLDLLSLLLRCNLHHTAAHYKVF